MQTFYKHDNEGIKKKSVMMYSSLQMVCQLKILEDMFGTYHFSVAHT